MHISKARDPRAPRRRRPLLTAAVFALLCAAGPLAAQPFLSGTPRIKQALKRLNTLGGILMIGAHPDDENNSVLAYFARGRTIRTGYLSATRGEGGQNLIGSELGPMLGLIRTQELLAARRVDGAEQFFTRAIDFGFSKSADETMAKWGREETLADMVWVIRRFRPDVVVLRFSGTARDGHGHHTASAILGREAFLAAGDDRRFPEQLKYVDAWQPARLLFNVFSFTREQENAAATLPSRLEVDTGEYDPVIGKSYNEIAGTARSMHRTQGFGSPERRGPSKNYFTVLAGKPAKKDPFEDIDTTWNRLTGGAAVRPILERAAHDFVPEHPEATIPALAAARALAARIRDPWATLKLAEIDEAIALCAGMWIEAPSGRYAALPGSSLKIDSTAVNRSQMPMDWKTVTLDSGASSAPALPLAYNQVKTALLEWAIPDSQPYSQPFWLRLPRIGERYDIPDQRLIGDADRIPDMSATFEFGTAGETAKIRRPVEYRYVDPARGELTRPLIVVPPVAVNLPENVRLFPEPSARAVRVELSANQANITGDLRLELPAGWSAQPGPQAFRLDAAGESKTVEFRITPPGPESQAVARVVATVGGREIAVGQQTIAYPHIPPQTVFPPSEIRLVRANAATLARKVGYIMGAGDEMPGAIRQLGCEVTIINPETLASGSLAQFDAIVVGIRAYNVRADLRANQKRLLDYVHGGGTLVVQYNVAEGGPGAREAGSLARIGPYPLRVGRARVSVEEAPVAFTDRNSPLLHAPNQITGRDFEGWVQERGLYFASEWDPQYHPAIECHDPGEPPQPGGTLWTRYGDGAYVFTAYSWFRQLPAGVPGAYRIFANLLSAGKAAR
jgi:LmbE family N-acetylglucosaminyl deacetylase